MDVNKGHVMQLPLESLQRAGLYGQAFVNGGTSALLDRGKGGAFRRCLDHLAASPRWTMVRHPSIIFCPSWKLGAWGWTLGLKVTSVGFLLLW